MQLTTAMCLCDILGLTLDELTGKKEPYRRASDARSFYCPKCGTEMKRA